MKITLIMPHGEIHRKGGIFKRSLRYAPLTLTTLAALVPQELGAEIKIIDEGVEELDVSTIDADIVGITCITGTSYRAYEIAQQLRERGITVVIGGVHPTLVPDEVQQHADAIVTGFAEESWPRLLRDFAQNRLESRYVQGPGYRFQDMPEPRRDLLKKKEYITTNTVQATRGCPLKCSFCVVPVAWPGYLHRPIKEVIAEIERLDGKTFIFLDLSPIEEPVYIKQLYRELIPLKKRWGGLATMRLADDLEMLDLASKSGCRGVLIGIESVSPETVRRVGKKFHKPEQYKEQIKRLHDHGIAVNGCFVLGLDGDQKDVFERTAEFAIDVAIDLPRFSVPTPFPNTALYHQYKKKGRLLTEDWRLYDTQHVVFQPESMTPEELQEGLGWTWRQVYSIPSIIRRIIGSSASLSPQMFMTSTLANLGYRFFSDHIPKYTPIPCEQSPWSAPLALSTED